MFEIEWINNQGDREMNDVKMQKQKRMGSIYSNVGTIIKYAKGYWRKI